MSAIDTTTLQSLLNEVVEVLLDAYGAGVFPFGWDWDTESILCVRPRRSQPGTGSVEMAAESQSRGGRKSKEQPDVEAIPRCVSGGSGLNDFRLYK
jgi:hypothetical protein